MKNNKRLFLYVLLAAIGHMLVILLLAWPSAPLSVAKRSSPPRLPTERPVAPLPGADEQSEPAAQQFHEQRQPGYFRWRDQQGRTHYGARPPAGVAAEEIDMDAVNMAVIKMAPASKTPPTAAETRQPPVRSASQAETGERRAIYCAQQLQERIRYIDARLRAGYKAREGERLKDRRRILVKQRSEHCH